MHRPVARLLFLSVALAPWPAGAQPSAAPVIPSTPAGVVLRAWLDAYSSTDTARLGAYYRKYQPDLSVESALPFIERTGGFELLTIERSEARRVEFLVKERRGPTTAYGIVGVSDAEPLRVTTFRIMGLGPNVTAKDLSVDAGTRVRVIEGAIAQLDSFYVFPAVAREIADSLRARVTRGVYDSYANGFSLASRLALELREIGRDKHLRMDYSAQALPPRPASPPPPTPEVLERRRQRMDEINCGFVKAEQLPGNVGYLKFNQFSDPELCASTASSALSFLAGTSALIVDLRENGGGSPAMVAHISSYLFDERTHLNDLWNRRSGETQEFWTRDSVPGRRFGGRKPVYVLTALRTFSGAEEFAYNLKALGRATIVGETTGGGAHPVAGRRIDDHFTIGVPVARAINPITRTNWEGVGVEPDVKVPASEALSTALRLVRERARP